MDKDPKKLDGTMKEDDATTRSLDKSQFITSSLCGTNACVGVAIVGDGEVFVQDTKDFARQPLRFDKDEWQAFVAGVKNGEFDA